MLPWFLRVGVAMEFVGHGAMALFQKPGFADYLGVVGLREHAPLLRPLVGLHDQLLALIVLFAPVRAVLLWATAWGLWTALLRPLAGEPAWEFFERWCNFGGPLALLLLADTRSWWTPVRAWRSPPLAFATLLRLAVASMLIGHGGLAAIVQKPMFEQQWSAIGVTQMPFGLGAVSVVQGWLELVAGLGVLLVPSVPLLVAIALWKVGTEALAPLTGVPPFHPWFEFIEHGAAYACPLALAVWVARRRPETSGLAKVAVPVPR